MVEDVTGRAKVLDWSGGPSSDSGNSSLLPHAFHRGPMPREELLTQLGASRAAQMVNRHTLGYYVMAVCLALESSVDAASMQPVAQRMEYPTNMTGQMMNMAWRLCAKSLLSDETCEDIVAQLPRLA